MPDARCTRGLMRNVHGSARMSIQGSGESFDNSLPMALRAYNALSPVSMYLLPPVDATSGRQDHTSLPYALMPFVSAHGVHRVHPTFVAIMIAPLTGTGCNR